MCYSSAWFLLFAYVNFVCYFSTQSANIYKIVTFFNAHISCVMRNSGAKLCCTFKSENSINCVILNVIPSFFRLNCCKCWHILSWWYSSYVVTWTTHTRAHPKEMLYYFLTGNSAHTLYHTVWEHQVTKYVDIRSFYFSYIVIVRCPVAFSLRFYCWNCFVIHLLRLDISIYNEIWNRKPFAERDSSSNSETNRIFKRALNDVVQTLCVDCIFIPENSNIRSNDCFGKKSNEYV